MIGIGSWEAITKPARKIDRKHSMGPSSSSLKAVALLFALKNLFRMLGGTRWYEKGIRVRRRNLQFGFSSILPYISWRYSETRSTERIWTVDPSILLISVFSPSFSTGSRSRPENR